MTIIYLGIIKFFSSFIKDYVMKFLNKLEINHVSGGDIVHAGTKFPGYVFDLYGNCNITTAGNPSDILWDGADMALGITYEATVSTTQFGGFHYDSTYNVTKYCDRCQFDQIS